MHENELSQKILVSAIEVHRTLGGCGLLESVYEEALAWELEQAGLRVNRQLVIPIQYKEHKLSTPLKLDLMVNNQVIIECKATHQLHEVYKAQLLTYLRLTGLKLGLLINFGEKFVKNRFFRVVNNL